MGDRPYRETVPILRACEIVSVSRRTMYNWIAAGKVEYIRNAGGAIRIFTDSLWKRPSAPRCPKLSAQADGQMLQCVLEQHHESSMNATEHFFGFRPKNADRPRAGKTDGEEA